MKIEDNIYGQINIEDKVIEELLRAPSILRLKNISQFGIPDKYYHYKNFSRYEHSVGVMILLKKLGAGIEEQLAGLLHDASVLAFSHITDWVFGKGREGVEDYHDTLHEEFLQKTEIPNILKKYSFAVERILDDSNFSLLENESPDLCADRVDFALREFEYWLNPSVVKSCIEGLINYNGEIVFDNKQSAFHFAVNYLQLQVQHWGGYEGVRRYNLFSNILKRAMELNIIKEEDFYKDEKYILDKLESSGDNEIEKILEIMSNKKLPDMRNGAGEKVRKKFRHVNPKILIDERLVRLSEVNSKFANDLEKYREENKRGLIV